MSDSSRLFLIIVAYNDPEAEGHVEIMPLYYYNQDRISLDTFLDEYIQVFDTVRWKLEEWGISAQLTVYPVPEFITSTKCGLFASDGTELELIEGYNFDTDKETTQ